MSNTCTLNKAFYMFKDYVHVHIMYINVHECTYNVHIMYMNVHECTCIKMYVYIQITWTLSFFFTLMEQLMRDDSLALRVMRSKSEVSDFFKS